MSARAWFTWLAFLTAFVSERGVLAEPAADTWPVGDVAALATSRGRLFVGMFDRGLFAFPADRALEESAASSLNPNINALLVNRAGTTLFLGTARGLFSCGVRKPADCTRIGDKRSIHALAELGDGSVLAGGDGGLVVAAPDGTARVIDRKQGAPFRAVWALALAPDGTLFVGTTSGVHFAPAEAFLSLGRGEPAANKRRFGRAAVITGDLADDWVTALAISNDTVHVGTYNAGIASFRLAGGALTRTAVDPALGYVNPNGIETLPDGRLAVATMQGLRVGVPGSFRTVPTLGKDVTAVLAADAGDYWVASRRGVERMRLTPDQNHH